MMIGEPLKDEGNTTRDTISEQDALHIWSDIDAHLQFAEQVIQKTELATQIRNRLLEQLWQIQLRRNDPQMYLAIVGEFNAGKSTFINALIGEELLKATVDVTTATSTRLCYGSQSDLEIRFRDMKKALSYRQDRSLLWQKLQSIAPALSGNPDNIRSYINAVTAENKVAAQIESVVIHHPASFLTNGIVIIDTPGINAEYTTHAQITYRVVQHEADAAIVIIPAPVPLAQTLTAFLLEHLRPYLHRCIFVVTQMDKIQEREQKRLLDTIQARLTKALSLDQPMVLHQAAPQIVLDMQQNGASVAPALQHWLQEFGELEQALWGRLRRERALSVTGSLLRLMAALFEQLDTHLRERWLSYEARQVAIKRETIQDLASFAAQQRQVYQRTTAPVVRKARAEIDKKLAQRSEEATDSIRQAIFAASDASALKSVLDNTVQAELAQVSEDFQKILSKRARKLAETARQAGKMLDEQFAREYQKLQVLAGTVAIKGIENLGQDIDVNASSITYSAGQVNKEMDGTEAALGWGGAAVGAAIGTAIFPIVGTVIGALAGPLLVGIFGPSLSERQSKSWAAVQPALNTALDTMKAQALEAWQRYEQEVQTAFEQRLTTYTRSYQATVKTMIQQQQRELATIQRLQQTIQSDQQELARRRSILTQKQEQLAKKNV